MNSDTQQSEPAPKRGDAAYKAEREGIDKRNAEASKRGKEERQTADRAAIDRNRAVERRQDAELGSR